MEIGAEISQKIRCAIQAKLIEQGAYVDDELPDYIMVMVANKKSQKQMTDDLSLFLGTNTDTFTLWLHSLLKKLQSLNTDEPVEHMTKQKDKQQTENKKRKSRHSRKDKPVVKTAAVTEKSKKTPALEKETIDDKDEEDMVDTRLKAKPFEEELKTEISISENTDEFAEEFKELEKNERSEDPLSVKQSSSKVLRIDMSAHTNESLTIPSRREDKTLCKQRKSSSSMKHKDENKMSYKKPTSITSSVKRKYEEKDEECDPLNLSVGKIASVAQDPSRKSSIPKSLQANKSLLMKAVSEAERSISLNKKPEITKDLKHQLQKTPAGLKPISSSQCKEQQESVWLPKEPSDYKSSSVDIHKKAHLSFEHFENLRYTVKNEVAVRKSLPKKALPKPKAPLVMPSRVATSAFCQMGQTCKTVIKMSQTCKTASKLGQTCKTVTKKDPRKSANVVNGDQKDIEYKPLGQTTNHVIRNKLKELDNEDVDEADNWSSPSHVNSSNQPWTHQFGESESSYEDSDLSGSSEEIELEVTDRAAQTVISMRDKNIDLVESKFKMNIADIGTQTDELEKNQCEESCQKLSKEKLEEIDGSLMNFFIENLFSFNFIENDALKIFAKTLEPKYHFPKRKKFMTKVGMLYNNIKASLKADLTGSQSVAFTHKTWTDTGLECQKFDTVTAHFLTDDWTLKSAVLRTSVVSVESLVESIAQYLEETRLKWNLVPVFVTEDSDINNKIQNILNWKKVACFGSCIYKMIKKCLNSQEVRHFLDRVRSLLSEVFKNTTFLDLFGKKKILLLSREVQLKRLTLDDSNNWNSTLDMITNLCEQTPALHATIMDTELTNQCIDLRCQLSSFNDHNTLVSFVKVLTPFVKATEILTNTEYPTLQKVIPIFVKLLKVVESNCDDSSLIADIKAELKQKIDSALETNRGMCLLACLIHPQTKQMAFVDPRDKESVKTCLFAEIKDQCEKELLTSQSDMEGQFKKSRIGNQRQAKALSNCIEETDEKRVLNKDFDYAKLDEDTDNNDGNSQVSDVVANDVKVQHGGNMAVIIEKSTVKSIDNRSSDLNNGALGYAINYGVRNASEMMESSKINLSNLSITVDNDWLDDVICAADEQRSPEETAKIELNLYMAEPASSRNPLEWWKEKETLYPHIGRVAKKILAIPASSITAEEVFSLEKKQETLLFQIKPDYVDMMVFLQKNRSLYNKKVE